MAASALLVALLLVGTVVPVSDPSPLMTASDLARLPRPPADHRLAYGPEALQFGELRLPEGAGPHPVVIVIHGGCWLAEYGLGYISALAEDLTAAGVATWSIEYRRVGDEGGGWPGTFGDVADAADALRSIAPEHRLDLDRVVALGHSAGGHLALWLAARPGLAAGDPLRGDDPLPLRGVVGLAAITDLSRYTAPEGCGSAVPGLLGGHPSQVAERLRRASPILMVPLGVPQVLLRGSGDLIVPRVQATAYAEAARRVGETVEVREMEGAGHFELVAPGTPACAAVVDAVVALVGRAEGD